MTDAQQRPEVRDLTELLVTSDTGVLDTYRTGQIKETIYDALAMMDESEASTVLASARTLSAEALTFALKVIRDHTDMFGSAPLADEQDIPDRQKDMAAKMSCAVHIAPLMASFGHEDMNATQCHSYTLTVIKILSETLVRMPSTGLLTAGEEPKTIVRGISAMHSHFDNWLPPRDRRDEYLWAGEHWQALAPYADVIRARFEPDREFLERLLDTGSVALRHGVL